DQLAPAVAGGRLPRRADALRARRAAARPLVGRRGAAGLAELARRGVIAAGLVVDPWGAALEVVPHGGPDDPVELLTSFDLVSAGPDGRFGNGDDVRFEDAFADLGFQGFGYGSGSGAGFGEGRGGMAPSV